MKMLKNFFTFRRRMNFWIFNVRMKKKRMKNKEIKNVIQPFPYVLELYPSWGIKRVTFRDHLRNMIENKPHQSFKIVS